MALSKTKLATASALIAAFAVAPVMAQDMNWDSDGDGMVSADEFEHGMDRGESFDRLDSNEDGMVDRAEYNEGFFASYDADQSGDLDKPEAEALYSAHSEGPFANRQIKP